VLIDHELAKPAPDIQANFASTANVSPRDRFDYWHDVVCRNLVDLDYRLLGKGQFDATLHNISVGSLHLCRIQASPHVAERSVARISNASNSALVLNFVLSGSLIAEQDGRTTLLKPGDGALCDTDRPYRLHLDEAFDLACIRIPREFMACRVSHLNRMSARNFSEHCQLAPMAFAYLSRLVERAPNLTGRSSVTVSQNFIELLVALVSELAECEPLRLSEYRGYALVRIKETIERHLHQSDLTTGTIASELKLSQRYINQLFEAEGTSLWRYIWSRRLAKCAAQLKDPILLGRGISQIAIENGFNDLSHFSKAFRGRYGVSAREFRLSR
jgi:AraC family transcriptional regulator, positive regulator of tynA and feaB